MTDTDALARRIADLEAEVAGLRRAPRPAGSREEPVSRRRLLRHAGVAAAAAAGMVASPALTGRAAAADGDFLELGDTANTAASETALTRNAAGPTLTLQNDTGVPLRLAEADPSTVGAGDVFMDPGGFFWGAFGTDAAGMFYDTSWAALPVLFEPFRILDTRVAGATSTNFGRSRVTNPTNKFDSVGRLKAGSSIDLRLDDFSEFAFGAIVNVTVTGSAAGGYLRSWPDGSSPPESSIINYTKGQSVANGLTLPIGFDLQDRDSISFDANQGATHVIVDISGLIVGDPLSVVFSTFATPASAQQRRFRKERGLTRSR